MNKNSLVALLALQKLRN